MRRKMDRSAIQGEVLDMFKAAIKSPLTRDVYERRLLNFLGHLKMTPEAFLSIAKKSPGKAEKKIISYAFELKGKNEKGEIAAGTVHNCVKCVRLLLEMNDIFLNWKKISRILPRVRRYALDRIPRNDEIREILDASDIRSKALTIVLLSSGIREGSIELLRIGDYVPIKRDGKRVAGKIIVYSGEPEQYIAFVTIEAAAALEKYIEYRKEHCEDVISTSPLFRDAFDPTSNGSSTSEKHVKTMTAHAIRQHYSRLLRSIGLRKERKKRHDFSVHGFRKYFKTRAEQSGMKPINVEILMGHSVGISDSYYKPTETELLEDYLNSVDALTVTPENHLRHQVEKLKVENAEIDIMKNNYLDMKLSLEGKDEQVARLTDTVAVLSDQYNILSIEIERMKK
jgi:integrase